MERTEIFSRVKDIVAEVLRVEGNTIQESTNLKNDLGADSLDGLDIDLELDKCFNITTSQEDLDRINSATVGDIVELVERKLSSKKTKKL